jgi:hypothetical protein
MTDNLEQFRAGKLIVEEDFRNRGATEFNWNGVDFDSRTYAITFTWKGTCYRVLVNYACLTDLPNDSQQAARLEALWESKREWKV